MRRLLVLLLRDPSVRSRPLLRPGLNLLRLETVRRSVRANKPGHATERRDDERDREGGGQSERRGKIRWHKGTMDDDAPDAEQGGGDADVAPEQDGPL